MLLPSSGWSHDDASETGRHLDIDRYSLCFRTVLLDKSVIIVTRSWARQPENRGSFLDRARFFSSPYVPDQLWGPLNILSNLTQEVGSSCSETS
jgi:hypothetical protein